MEEEARFMQPASASLQRPSPGERGFDVERLLAPEQAIVAYFARAELAAPRAERVGLVAAVGRVLAREVEAREDHPSHVRSTMDGFAIRSGGGTERAIVGEVRMGSPAPRAIGPDEALRIPTGGALPEGADAVIPIEDVDENGASIALRAAVKPGENLTQRGADVRAGERVFGPGRRLGAPELGVLATLGYDVVDVFARPRFGIISTGDELVDPGTALSQGQIRDSNRYALGASLQAFGAEAVQLPRVRDDLDALRRALGAALESCDGVLLTGGSSVGERDYTPRVVAELGEPGPIVHGIRVKPGKPTLLAAVGGKPIIGLPGNPASSLMILEAVARPIVVALTGEAHARARTLEATASAPIAGRTGWTWYVPARVGARGTTLVAEPLPLRSSHTSLLSRAAGYVTLDELRPRIEAGERVSVTLFSCGGAPIESLP
jgi:molybdenum cofactor synthesis domain-containing protein